MLRRIRFIGLCAFYLRRGDVVTRDEKIILLQKQVSIARKALKEIDYNHAGPAGYVARNAIDEIEQIQVNQLGMRR